MRDESAPAEYKPRSMQRQATCRLAPPTQISASWRQGEDRTATEDGVNTASCSPASHTLNCPLKHNIKWFYKPVQPCDSRYQAQGMHGDRLSVAVTGSESRCVRVLWRDHWFDLEWLWSNFLANCCLVDWLIDK